MTKRFLRILAVAVMAGLGVSPLTTLADGHVFDPFEPPAEGKGSVYGNVTARPHKDYVRKAVDRASKNIIVEDPELYGASADGKIVYNDTMVNYELVDVYAILLNPAAKPGKVHEVEAETDEGLAPQALAVAKGDVIRIENDTPKPLTFFLVDINGDAIQELPTLAPGATADMTVELAGDLELSTDEDERLKAAVLSREGLQSRRIRSGSTYDFRDMPPGEYDLLFWFWRLGALNQKVTIVAGEHTRVNGVLSVDTIVR
ncbi:MAG: hypothetical protein JKY68_03075 [Rhodospirillales bacterium]|nr:hypothetical protein [Rhodospirillales bacterium]